MINNKKSVAIIGAGIGGITISIYLAQKGYTVKIFERNEFPGGRCGHFVKDGYRFDIGATLLMIPHAYKDAFKLMDKELDREIELCRLDPIYKLMFDDGKELSFSSDIMKMKLQLEFIEKGSFNHFLKYMNKGLKIYKLSMKHFIERNFYTFFSFCNFKNFFLLLKLEVLRKHYSLSCNYFKSDILRHAFTFQNIYVGQDPFTAPGLFSMLPFMELADGVWFPKGGMFKVIDKLLTIAEEKKVEIFLKSPIKSIQVDNDKATGIIFEDETSHPFDIIVSNADLPYTYNTLLPESKIAKRMNKMSYSCSAIVFHWAMDIVIPKLEQHTIFVSKNFKENIQAIFKGQVISEFPSFYIHSPVKSDLTAAPEGHDSISVIVPVEHLVSNKYVNWNEIKQTAKKAVLDRLKEEGIKDFEKHIRFEVCYTPESWKKVYNISRGSVFGSLSHNILQMGYFRPHNQHKKYKNLFFVGGSTHPGNGVPMSLISAKLSFEKIMHSFN